MSGSNGFRDLGSYFQAIRSADKRKDYDAVDSLVLEGKGFCGYSFIRETIPKVLGKNLENPDKCSEQMFNFVFSTGEKSCKKLSSEKMTSEMKFFACVIKYYVIQGITNANFGDDLKKEMEILDKFFKNEVAPNYKKDIKSKTKMLSPSTTEGERFSIVNNMFMAMEFKNKFNSDFIDNMLEAVPEFLESEKIHFQGTNLINRLITGSTNHLELAKKHIEKYPEKIYSFSTSVDDERRGYDKNIRGKSLEGTIFNFISKVDNNGDVYYDRRTEPNFLANVIHMMNKEYRETKEYGKAEYQEDKKKSTELFYLTLDTLNHFIEKNIDKKETMEAINYHLNCGVVVNGKPASLTDVLRKQMDGVEATSREAEILHRSLDLLNSGQISLKTIEELESEKIESERTSKLESKRAILNAELDQLALESEELSRLLKDKQLELAGMEERQSKQKKEPKIAKKEKQEITDAIADIRKQLETNENNFGKTTKSLNTIIKEMTAEKSDREQQNSNEADYSETNRESEKGEGGLAAATAVLKGVHATDVKEPPKNLIFTSVTGPIQHKTTQKSGGLGG